MRRFAFFDVDDTLISIKSMFDFLPFWCNEVGRPELARRFDTGFAQARAIGKPREALNRLYYRFFRGASPSDLEAVGAKWFMHRFRHGPSPYIDGTVARLKAHRSDGVRPVMVSGSMLPLLRPIADDLDVEHCLCTRLLLDDCGLLTGEIGDPQTIGQGKAVAMQAFMKTHRARAADCFAYGDDPSDIAMLEAVGTPVAVGSAAGLLAVAQQRGWACLSI